MKAASVYVHHFEHSSINANKLDYKAKMVANNIKLYEIWGDKILFKEKELLQGMTSYEVKRRYPFIFVFKKIKLDGIAETF